MTDLVVVEEIQILAQQPDDSVLQEVVESVEILAVAEQGPQGIQGVPGPAGGATLIPVGATPLSGHSAVALGGDGKLQPADCTLAAHRGAVLGVVANAYAAGADAVVSNNIPLEHAGWTWAVGPVFLGAAGVLTQALPVGAKFSQVVGHAVSATRVLIDVQPPINIA
ncbi:hypothetical protein [Diaphorobacter sp. ED-3]|uniref:hypothetical protein n=1 Tax=Diaphorobacter sp. ED-3 TaxID=3016636 RepID=UPI0022DE3EE6|nr:hypothetical protein [Diaphorobacter sp. ED-3]